MSFRSTGSAGPMTLSQVPGSPSFRSSAVNAIAVIPLLSSDRNGQDDPNTFSSKSFQELLEALNRYNTQGDKQQQQQPGDDTLLVVPNANLTRPGDWRYDNTPLKNFHWGHGCQRLSFFDGRPYNSRMAHDRLINHELTRNWIDLCPHRRTAALIGVLNVRDCPDMETLLRAEQEWQQWAERYSTPPYEVTAHGRDFERDVVVQRLFVYDSFHESNKIDLSQNLLDNLGSSLVAFPPSDNEHTDMMDMHMNIVINDLAIAIFQGLEGRIRESDTITKGTDGQPLSSAAARSRFSLHKGKTAEEGPQGSADLDISNLASVVSPDSKLAATAAAKNKEGPIKQTSISSKLAHVVTKGSSWEAQLLTPLDDFWDFSELSPKDAQEMMRREVGRREKFAADLSMLAGSPLDAYGRYVKAADLCKTTCPDPLWYASALEGCAAAHIAMAEAGGFNVDTYLESSFQLPDELMACAVVPSGEKSNKQTMSRIVAALCDDALNVTIRHPKLACFQAELLLKLAWYCAEVEDTHVRCQWGVGEGCYGGDPMGDKRRWEMSSATQLNFLELKNKDGDDVVARNTLKRCQKWTDFMHRAVSTGALDPVTRADVALRCASMCLKGLRPTDKPTSRQRSDSRLQFRRKAAFFAVAAAEALSEIEGDIPDERASAMWVHASKMLGPSGYTEDGGNYGWATLRAVALHGLALQGLRESSEDAAVQLLSLMSEISPSKRTKESGVGLFFSKFDSLETEETNDNFNDSIRSSRSDAMADTASYVGAESVVNAARSYVRERAKEVAKDARARGVNFFTGPNIPSSLLAVAQSKWVDDDPIRPVLYPMADDSEISHSIIAMRSVWSAIKYENCATEQKKLIGQITELRKNMPAASLSRKLTDEKSSSLPIKITSAVMVDSESHPLIERVKVKRATKNQGAMATFYNPYANKKGETGPTIVPEGEERYILVKFANKLSIPLEVPRCQLEFNIPQSDRIKAPAISFVIPGQTHDFAVQFPFIILNSEKDESSQEEASNIYEVKGLHVTCLARSFFLPLEGSSDDSTAEASDVPNIPDAASLYPLRKYSDKKSENGEGIKSPSLEVVPSQPNILISFAASPTPLEEDTTIPAPLADGEVFALPKLCLANDPGLNGLGRIEKLRITAVGLPGYSEIVLFDLEGPQEPSGTDDPEENIRLSKKVRAATPLSLSAHCEGMDDNFLNAENKGSGKSSISLELAATADMGAHTKGCTVTLRFRYRGKAMSTEVEFWRKREVKIRVIRIKGPRISALTFRPDLTWESAYSQLCNALSDQDKHKRYRPSQASEMDLLRTGSTDNEEFVVNRLGKDPGVHVCSDKVVVLVSVVNETTSAILLSTPGGRAVGGFERSPMETLTIPPGVSAKIPMILPRVDRAPAICGQLVSMTSLQWKSKILDSDTLAMLETGGTMVPVNRRVRCGSMEIPSDCLKTLIDENPTFLSRICKAPCSVKVGAAGGNGKEATRVAVGKPLDISVDIELADWVPAAVLKQSNFTLEFCCARKDVLQIPENGRDYVWCGQIRKALPLEERKHGHRARIVFLSEGDYAVSACVSFSRTDNDDDVKEIWWAQKAQNIHVEDLPLSQ